MNALTDKAQNEAAKEQPAAELMTRYSKKEKVVCLVNDDMDAFTDFLQNHIKEGNYTDLTEGADEKVFNGGFALVLSENKVNRLIPIANEDAVFADPVARKALYRMYVNKVVNAAFDSDINPASFITVGGNFKQKFDLDAFKFQWKGIAKILRENNLAGVTSKSLQQAFASHAFAKTQFPRMSDKTWDVIIGIAEKQAQAYGYDTSIFDHWKATRAVASADTTEITLDFGEFETELTEAIKEKEEKTKE